MVTKEDTRSLEHVLLLDSVLVRLFSILVDFLIQYESHYFQY